MKKFSLFLYLFTLITLSSCVEYKFGFPISLDLEFDGINMSANNVYGGYIGEIPASGAKFSIVGKGKDADYTFINYYGLDDIHLDKMLKIRHNNKPSEKSKLTIEGEWGEIRNTQENKIFININPNNSNKSREFLFYVGDVNDPIFVTIKQPPMTTE